MKQTEINQTKTKTGTQAKRFISISTPDGSRKIWVARPTAIGRIYAACNFGLNGNMKFVDALDKLAYVTVDQATTFNDSYSRLVMVHTGEGKSCLEKLMEDLPAIMEEYL